ncbi:hypothetical protein WICANDRAFT_77344 [Wickerhamomyces anomalus NRRL Y-366-8]|uniref:Dephospho-CoA kinase n=1 Tax=Wickerhamomyces anomalus (strain ATCC 58044 / CBS 1984 / NCYC 433 / NRRL Y-366-8) TaxID=683960 RepID=A0A1E3P5C3_WICAA|nr:uncharacterized protein WICANDRAFT_77344 [Wickerhamomyces anomalus NRRL Y-366-8]ODQ60666.1 hypothetical protein WICANDRAFT_77344 [Wickerhamomyces anomalus NRRL Y-366-8]
MLIVGLTGGIAAGKSTVSEKLSKEYGLTVIDADLIARQVQQPGQSAYKKIAKYFGPQVEDLFLEDGQLNRPSLGRHVFGNPEELKKLNSFVHPAVRYEIFKQIIISYLKLQKLVILDVPLLFEAKLDQICGATIAVVCDEKLQLERLLKRNSYLTEEDAKQRINSQMSNHSRIRKADYIIDNSHTLEALDENIRGVVQRVTPSWIIYLLELFPVFAAFSAFGTFIIRRIHEWDNDSKQE